MDAPTPLGGIDVTQVDADPAYKDGAAGTLLGMNGRVGTGGTTLCWAKAG